MKPVLTAIALATALALIPLFRTSAAPTLKIGCALPNSQHVVTCTVRGQGFHPAERIRVTYRLTYTDLSAAHGKHPQRVYVRMGTTDREGSFVRPRLGFGVQPGHASYRLTVSVLGARGDRATLSYTAIEN